MAAARRTMAATAVVAALVLGMTACSESEDGVTEEPATQTAEQTATTIHVTVGAGITDPTPDPSPTREGSSAEAPAAGSSAEDGAAAPLPSRGGAGVGSVTRSTVTKDGSTRTLKFTPPVGEPGDENYSPGDRLYVWRSLGDSGYLAGMLSMKAGTLASDGQSATFEGELTYYGLDGSPGDTMPLDDPLAGSTAQLVHDGMTEDVDYSIDAQSRKLSFKDGTKVAADVATLMTTGLAVEGNYYEDTGYMLQASEPILNIGICGLAASTTYQFVLKKDGTEARSVTRKTDATGTALFAFASSEKGTAAWSLDVWPDGVPDRISFGLGSMPLEAKVYNISRYYDNGTFTKTINLASVNDDLTVPTGLTLTGTLGGNYKISIAPGATVTLSGARIQGATHGDWDNNYTWAGITCLGDATIVLANGRENFAKGYNSDYPGIQAGPTGTTLTICGSGTLTAETGLWSNGSTIEGLAAGIGGGVDQKVGNIKIEGGTITANGYLKGAGIGSGYANNVTASCGNITITGGTVTATGGLYAAGIGSGKYSSCGDITIGGTATGTAMGGDGSPNDIGAGAGGTCGTVSVAEGTISYVIHALVPCTFNITFVSNGNAAQVYTTGIALTGSAEATLSNGEVIRNGTSITAVIPSMRSGTLIFTANCILASGHGTAVYTCTLNNVRIARNAANTFDVVMQPSN